MTVHRAFPECLEREFFVRMGGADSQVSRRVKGKNICFQPMRTRQVSGMAFVIPPTAGSQEEDGVNRPFRVASFRGFAKTRIKRRITAMVNNIISSVSRGGWVFSKRNEFIPYIYYWKIMVDL